MDNGVENRIVLPLPARDEVAVAQAAALAARYRDVDAPSLLRVMIEDEFQDRIALVSSFGAEAAVLLHMVSSIDASTPVIFLDTGKLFGETLRYRDQLVERLGLTDLRVVKPDAERIESLDPDGILWYANPDMCCCIRKVEPFAPAIEGFAAWINGRKGFHGGDRNGLQRVEATDDGIIKINPLADWRKPDVEAYFAKHDLPAHPLVADGYLSIGCMPCTDRVAPGEDARAGRWRGLGKTECGIHLPNASRWRMDGID